MKSSSTRNDEEPAGLGLLEEPDDLFLGVSTLSHVRHSPSLTDFSSFRWYGLRGAGQHGNVQYVGSAWATEQNNVEAGSTTLFNAGFSYDFSLGEHDLTLIGNVYNLFDRKYWRLIPNIARTYMGEGRNVSLSIVGRF